LHEGKPFITASGVVELWHHSCWSTRHARGVEVVTIVAPRPRVPPTALFAGAATLAAIVAIVPFAHSAAPPASIAVADLAVSEQAPVAVREAAREDAPPPPKMPLFHGQPLDDLFPSLREWVHPVSNSKELVPELQSRWFGAERIGVERPECGAGHCGIDLDGPRGQPLVAVADGVVVRVERHELGLDGRSGRYVRIEHDDGALTAYMHMDDIAPGLEVGDRVEAGQYIGTLGATAVYESAPHLHFSLEVPRRPGEKRGDRADTRYIDPAPFLARSTIVTAPDRRHARKPAM
jgi:murein DD-endopeptidase MepM/ murein hydrolase activator NlpD